MSKHTRGPWQAVGPGLDGSDTWTGWSGEWFILGPADPWAIERLEIAVVAMPAGGPGEQRANARLAAAAPELYAACRRMVVALDSNDGPGSGELGAALEAARATLARAHSDRARDLHRRGAGADRQSGPASEAMGLRHTPGPWQAVDYEDQWASYPLVVHFCPDFQDAPVRLALPFGPEQGGPSLEEARANARLIAAGPDLYAACRRFVGAMEARRGPGDPELNGVQEMARVALARSEHRCTAD